MFEAVHTETNLFKWHLKLKVVSILLAKIGFCVICDCSDWKRGTRLESGLAKNQIVIASLNAALVD